MQEPGLLNREMGIGGAVVCIKKDPDISELLMMERKAVSEKLACLMSKHGTSD